MRGPARAAGASPADSCQKRAHEHDGPTGGAGTGAHPGAALDRKQLVQLAPRAGPVGPVIHLLQQLFHLAQHAAGVEATERVCDGNSVLQRACVRELGGGGRAHSNKHARTQQRLLPSPSSAPVVERNRLRHSHPPQLLDHRRRRQAALGDIQHRLAAVAAPLAAGQALAEGRAGDQLLHHALRGAPKRGVLGQHHRLALKGLVLLLQPLQLRLRAPQLLLQLPAVGLRGVNIQNEASLSATSRQAQQQERRLADRAPSHSSPGIFSPWPQPPASSRPPFDPAACTAAAAPWDP